MSVDVFVDTNVLVYARDAAEAEKQARATEWMESLWESGRGRLSMQVLQEYYAVVTMKLRPGLPVSEARADVRALGAWDPVVTDDDLFERAWQLQDETKFSFWDALIVAAAERAHCAILLTGDLQAERDVAGLRIVNPFRTAPTEIG